jgi:DNA-3-methyladenine glycosylase II
MATAAGTRKQAPKKKARKKKAAARTGLAPSSASKAAAKSVAASKPAPKRAKRRRSKPAPERRYHPGPLIQSEATLTQAVAALLAQDPETVGPMLAIAGPPPLRQRAAGFEGLAAIIVSQQVSTASASAIFARLQAAIVPLDAESLGAASDETLRGCGLSSPKIRALRSLSEAVASGTLDLPGLAALDAIDAHAALVAVKGIGPWTADIFLLFCLGHPDAWPAGDLALQEAARTALNLKKRPDTEKLEKIGERWRPLRAVAARLLWSYYRAMKQGREGMVLAAAAQG